MPNPLQFQARHYDPSAKLYHFRARWYDPVLERFVSEDPIGLLGGINPYVYAGNDPVNRRDPSGLEPCRSGRVHLWIFGGVPRLCQDGRSAMLSPDTFLLTLYVLVDDFCKDHLPVSIRPGPAASLNRSEVLTLAIFSQWGQFKSGPTPPLRCAALLLVYGSTTGGVNAR